MFILDDKIHSIKRCEFQVLQLRYVEFVCLVTAYKIRTVL